MVAAVLETTATDAAMLTLEVTERVLVQDQLAHGLGMTVVAEGVETEQQHQTLTLLGADACQGFYFARPMPARAIDTVIARGPTSFPRAP
jgi:sensor c-di-GMP phosphodiesterase-like protein